jgi:parvulin-like peptidyl-prolyl isomerase
MTSRSRQASSRTRFWEDPTRRNMLMNLGFGLAIVAALLTLVVAGGAAWYGAHLAPAVTVNGVTLNMDDVARQSKVNLFLIDYQSTQTHALLSSGKMWATDATSRISALDSEVTQVDSLSANQLASGLILVDLADKNGQSITPQDISAAEQDTATQSELRHVWQIVVQPVTTTADNGTPTDAEKAAAKAKADQAAQALKGGGDWATIAKNFSTDTDTAPQGGDVGFIDKNSSLDTAFVDALMAAPLNTPTAVIAGADGAYRIGRVTEIVAPQTDPDFVQKAKNAGISQADLDAAFRFSAANKRLQSWIESQAMASAPQRHVYRIYLQNSADETGPSAVAVRHILFSPNHNASTAPSTPSEDPAWAAAKALADAAYAKLKADPSQFDALARAETDDTNTKDSGGKLGYMTTSSGLEQSFADAIFAKGLQPGQILPPVKTSYGYHVIQIMHYPTDLDWANKLATEATSLDAFKALARDNSNDTQAVDGGDMGWIGQHTYQVSDQIANAIFSAPVGKVSSVLNVDGDGVYLFWVAEEQTKVPDGDQAATIKANAFSTWYSSQSGNYTVWIDPALSSSASQ